MTPLAQAKRLGRGIGSGVGKTSGRGHKGQKARTGTLWQPQNFLCLPQSNVANVLFVVAPGTANLCLKQHIGPTFCHSTKAFQDREAVVACPRVGDLLKVITCLVLPTAGRNPKLGFEGGQTPLKKRAPRRGFHNP